jgi:Flp pilus assembly protein TadB
MLSVLRVFEHRNRVTFRARPCAQFLMAQQPDRRRNMKMKAKQISLVVCLFLFLFVVIGHGLHLNPAGAVLAAATGTPLLVYLFNQRSRQGAAEERMRHVKKSSTHRTTD